MQDNGPFQPGQPPRPQVSASGYGAPTAHRTKPEPWRAFLPPDFRVGLSARSGHQQELRHE